MNSLYKESLQAIKDLDSKPSKKEWNNIAKRYGFLNSISLSKLYGKAFSELSIEIRKHKEN